MEMPTFGLIRYPLSSCVAAALLVGCGGSQPPIGAPAAAQQSPTTIRHAQHGGFWMKPESASGDLIYAVGGCGGACVLTYPGGEQVGQITLSIAYAACSDTQGNVFITGGSTVDEFVHGGVTSVNTLTLPGNQASGCAVDPATNDLAVVYDEVRVAVFPNESGSPLIYSTKLSANYCGYDNESNLFVSGDNEQSHTISELPHGMTKFTILSVKGKLGNPGQVQWDGSHLTYESRDPINIARLSIRGSIAKVIGTTSFKGHGNAAMASWIYDGSVLLPYGGKVEKLNKIGLWPYPGDGKRTNSINFSSRISAVTVSSVP
ncbi:MAG TPA: hypothetical protein VGG51_10345 [Candidatus Cybelea sp.]|jgi:hypothetical protein